MLRYLIAFAGTVPLWRRAAGMSASRYVMAALPLLAVLLALSIEAFVVSWGRVGWALAALLAISSALITGLYVVQPHLGYDLAVGFQRTGYLGSGRTCTALGVDPGLLFPSLVQPGGSTRCRS